MKFTCIYKIMYGFLLNLFQFLCDISMKPDYRCNLCYAGDTYNCLINFIEEHNILYKFQFGFRKSHSTRHAIISMVEKLIML